MYRQYGFLTRLLPVNHKNDKLVYSSVLYFAMLEGVILRLR